MKTTEEIEEMRSAIVLNEGRVLYLTTLFFEVDQRTRWDLITPQIDAANEAWEKFARDHPDTAKIIQSPDRDPVNIDRMIRDGK